MSFSSTVAKQREKERKTLRYFLAFSFMGSAALHVIVLTFGSFWVRTPVPVQKPMEVIFVPRPHLQAAKLRENTRSQFRATARSNSGIKPIKKLSGALPLPIIAKKPSEPVNVPVRQKPVASLPPSRSHRSKPRENLPPVPTLPPQSELSPFASPLPQPVYTPRPQPTPFASIPPQPSVTPRPKPSAIVGPPTQPAQVTTNNSPNNNDVNRSETSRKARSHIPTSENRDSNGSGRDSSTRDSRPSPNPSNSSGSGAGTSEPSGNGSTIATGPGFGNGNSLTTGSGSGGLACRDCPAPEYPSEAEDLEGRAVVLIDVKRDGDVRDVQIVQSTGHDILDQTVLETVKKWKFASSENEQRVGAAVNFATPGSDFYHQARERERQARKLEQQRKQEHQSR